MRRECDRCKQMRNENFFVEDWTHCRKCSTKQELLDYFQPDLTKWLRGLDSEEKSLIIKRCMTLGALCFALTSCTYNISMAHTEGVASDTIDDTQSNTPTTSANITGLPAL